MLRQLFGVSIFLVSLSLGAPAAADPATKPARPYPTAHDQPLDPTEKLLQTTDDYALYRVEFNGVARNSRVPANLYIPGKSQFKPPYPAVLLQYGTGGNKNTNYIVAIGKLAVSRGLVVLTIDSPGRGERKGKEPPRTLLAGNILHYLGDYSRATDYLESRNDVDKKRLGYVGISWGAITGVTFAAHDPRIRVVASLVGGGNFAGLIPGAVTEEVLKATQLYDPCFHVPLIAPRPLLLLNVTKDQLVPRLMADSLHKAAPDYAKRIWLECDHFFNGVDREATAVTVIDWVVESLPK
jgi:dienelactone hydrolase